MNKEKKKPTKLQTLLGILLIVATLGRSMFEEDGEAFVIILGIVVTFAAVFAIIKKTGETKKQELTREQRPMAPMRPSETDCSYGDINCDYSHEYKRRIAQLNNFLANGIIDRQEYNVLLARYKKRYEEHTL